MNLSVGNVKERNVVKYSHSPVVKERYLVYLMNEFCMKCNVMKIKLKKE